jgi:RNA polymerase sigma factor (sigma-70 family)
MSPRPRLVTGLLSTQSDARLVELASQGHERAFETLVQRYRKPLLGYCRRLLLPESRAEDALQQGLLQAWLALQRGHEVREAKAWLYRIVHNAAITALRGSGYDYVELNDSLQGVDAAESDIDRRIAVREALAGLAALPPQQREALMRTAVEGHSHEQVAAAMGLSEGAVRGLVFRARAQMRVAVTAITPWPLVSWAAAGRGTPPITQRLSEVVAGGGSAGLGGLLLKGGAVAVSAGALATGSAAFHPKAHVPHAHAAHVAEASERLVAWAEPARQLGEMHSVVAEHVSAPKGEHRPAQVKHGHKHQADHGSHKAPVLAPHDAQAPVSGVDHHTGQSDHRGGRGERHRATGGGGERRHGGRGGHGGHGRHGGGSDGRGGPHGGSGGGSGSGGSDAPHTDKNATPDVSHGGSSGGSGSSTPSVSGSTPGGSTTTPTTPTTTVPAPNTTTTTTPAPTPTTPSGPPAP